MGKVFKKHCYLLNSDDLMDFEKEFFEKVLREDVPEAKIRDCMPFLCELLKDTMGQRP